MADVAELGFKVEHDQVDEATRSLKGMEEQAGKTTSAVQNLEQKIKTGQATQKDYTAAVRESFGIQGELSNSQARMLQNLALEQQMLRMTKLEREQFNNLTRAGVSAHSEVGRAIAAETAALHNARAAIQQTTQAKNALGLSTNQMRVALATASPALIAMGTELSNLSRFAWIARGGIAAMAAALTGGAIVALENAADKAKLLQERFQALFGNRSGAQLFAEMEEQAKRLGIRTEQLAKQTQTLQDAQSKMIRDFGFAFAPGQGGQDALRNLFGDVSKVSADIQRGFMATGMAADEATSKSLAFFQAIASQGGLSAETFRRLRDEAPQVANAIAGAFGYSVENIYRFERRLEATNIPLRDMFRILNQIGPAMQRLDVPRTVAQEWDKMVAAATHLMETIGKETGFHITKDTLAAITGYLKVLDDIAKDFSWDKIQNIENSSLREFVGLLKAAKEILDYFNEKLGIGGNVDPFGKLTTDMRRGFGMTTTDQEREAANRQFMEGADDPAALDQARSAIFDWIRRTFSPVSSAGASELNPDVMGGVKGGEDAFKDASATFQAGADAVQGIANAVSQLTQMLGELPANIDGVISSSRGMAEAVGALSKALADAAMSVAQSAMRAQESAASAAAAASEARFYASEAGLPGGSEDQGIVADVGDNASGGLYRIGSLGGVDDIALTGQVSPNEVVAVLPKEAASEKLLAQIRKAIKSSPITTTSTADNSGNASADLFKRVSDLAKGPVVNGLPVSAASLARLRELLAQAKGGAAAGGAGLLPQMQSSINFGGGSGGGSQQDQQAEREERERRARDEREARQAEAGTGTRRGSGNLNSIFPVAGMPIAKGPPPPPAFMTPPGAPTMAELMGDGTKTGLRGLSEEARQSAREWGEQPTLEQLRGETEPFFGPTLEQLGITAPRPTLDDLRMPVGDWKEWTGDPTPGFTRAEMIQNGFRTKPDGTQVPTYAPGRPTRVPLDNPPKEERWPSGAIVYDPVLHGDVPRSAESGGRLMYNPFIGGLEQTTSQMRWRQQNYPMSGPGWKEDQGYARNYTPQQNQLYNEQRWIAAGGWAPLGGGRYGPAKGYERQPDGTYRPPSTSTTEGEGDPLKGTVTVRPTTEEERRNDVFNNAGAPVDVRQLFEQFPGAMPSGGWADQFMEGGGNFMVPPGGSFPDVSTGGDGGGMGGGGFADRWGGIYDNPRFGGGDGGGGGGEEFLPAPGFDDGGGYGGDYAEPDFYFDEFGIPADQYGDYFDYSNEPGADYYDPGSQDFANYFPDQDPYANADGGYNEIDAAADLFQLGGGGGGGGEADPGGGADYQAAMDNSWFMDEEDTDYYAGEYAQGGTFRVPHTGGGTDSVRVALDASPDEVVTVTNPSQGGSMTTAGGRIPKVNVTIITPNPAAFESARLQVQRGIRGVFR